MPRDSPAPNPTLTLISLNVWGVFWPFSRRPGRRLRAISEWIESRPDATIALQEVWRETRGKLRAPVCVAAEQPTPLRATRAGFPWGLSADSGLALRAADGQTLRPWFHGSFTHTSGDDGFKQKGVFAADTEVDGVGDVVIATTHLQASRRASDVRRRQLEQLCAWLSRRSAPIALLGDFNLHAKHREDTEAGRVLRAAGFVDAARCLSSASVATYRRANPLVSSRRDERFDRVYLRDSARHRWRVRSVTTHHDDTNPLSDHDALEVVASLEEKDP